VLVPHPSIWFLLAWYLLVWAAPAWIPLELAWNPLIEIQLVLTLPVLLLPPLLQQAWILPVLDSLAANQPLRPWMVPPGCPRDRLFH
jgi:hypothetical protein